MMEESISEWGKVFALNLPAQPIRRTLLLKVFTTSRPFCPPSTSGGQAEAAPATSLAQSLMRQALPPVLRRAAFLTTTRSQALALNYPHPRVIDPPARQEPSRTVHKPLVPALLLTAVSTFTGWYIYRVTGQKLDLQTQVMSYAESLQQEKLARVSLTSPQIKILTLEEGSAGGVSAKIFWNPAHRTCRIYLAHLPPTAPHQFFQLWFYSAEKRFLRASRFSAESGAAELSLQLPTTGGEKLERVLVSVESATHYPFPEGQILVKGVLP